jgi:hypothetical protein
MFNNIKKVLLKTYMYFNGVSFYMSNLITGKSVPAILCVKYVEGLEINFYFHKETIKVCYYIFNKLYYKDKVIYIVSAEYSDNVPEKLKLLKESRLYAKGSVFRMINKDKEIYEILVCFYLDCLKKELLK